MSDPFGTGRLTAGCHDEAEPAVPTSPESDPVFGGSAGAGRDGEWSVAPEEQARGLKTMSSALPDAVNYHRWILDLIQPNLDGRVLEVGFGYGQYTREMARVVDDLVAVDLDPECLTLSGSLPGNVRLLLADVSADEFPDRVGRSRYHTAVCLNVLEHIEDDVRALRLLGEALRPDGRLLLLVPAHRRLYGPMDRLAGHYRRYSRGVLRGRFQAAGLAVRAMRYINPLGGLGWWANARFGRPGSLSDPSVNRQILWFDRYVQPLSRFLSPLSAGFFGQSLWAVAAPVQSTS
jgi:SAM-dependent methyltransferase